MSSAFIDSLKKKRMDHRHSVALLCSCIWTVLTCLLWSCSLVERPFFSHSETVNSPWCICQAGRGKGRFLDGPFESFQWWSPALLSARNSLPAPALGSPSSSCYGHFEQLKENKGLGLASTMTCKRMTWSLKQKWMSLDWKKKKMQFEKQQRTLLLVSVCFLEWLWRDARCQVLHWNVA